MEIAIRRAEVADVPDVGRLRRDLSTELGQPSPATNEDDSGGGRPYASCGSTNRESGPDGPTMLYHEREL